LAQVVQRLPDGVGGHVISWLTGLLILLFYQTTAATHERPPAGG
jgi:hypothetical protein